MRGRERHAARTSWGDVPRSARSSVGTPRPARHPAPSTGAQQPQRSAAAALLLARELAIFAEADFEEHEQHCSGDAGGDQRDREHLTGHSADEGCAYPAGEHERQGEPKREEALAGSHDPKVPKTVPPSEPPVPSAE
jgi:hypothetical protein